MSQYFFSWDESPHNFLLSLQNKQKSFVMRLKMLKIEFFVGVENINYKRKEGWKKAALKLLMMSK